MTNDNLDIPEEADRLFELPLDEFVSERKVIASTLRQAGRQADAERVSKLPKPTVAAWAANQIIRWQRRDIRRLLKAGEALEQAQEAAISGAGDKSSLREASRDHRNALDQLARALRGLLDGQGHSLSDAVMSRARDTLAAMSLDPRLRPYASCGRLAKEHSFSGGFELGNPLAGGRNRRTEPRGGRREKTKQSRTDPGKGATSRKPPAEQPAANVIRSGGRAGRACGDRGG